MAIRQLYYNCGAIELGFWSWQKEVTPAQLKKYEDEINQIVDQARAGWYKMIICTVLKEQEYIRKILRKYGFKKTPETSSKYKPENTQCIYYWDTNALKEKKLK